MRIYWAQDNTDEIIQKVKKRACLAAYQAVSHMGAEADKTCPFEEGVLVGTGLASVDDSEPVGCWSYDTVYACRQHEETGWRHDEGRRAKWLELTWKEQGPGVEAWLGQELRKAFA